MAKNKIIILTIILIIILTIIILISIQPSVSKVNSLNLIKSCDVYKKDYMSKDGRIMDPDRNNVTTSEGQAYMLLMSLATNDKKTFDLVYTWTKNNLSRKDKLFAWLWGKNKNGDYKIIDPNSASDADIDIAFSLLSAYQQWQDKKYLKEAIPIIESIWDKETRRVGKHLVLMPGVKQAEAETIEINPSYFSPYSFKLFQKYDDKHDWNELVDSSYFYLNEVMSKTKTGLPPNWFLIKNGQIIIEETRRGDFSYDAIRVFWRVYSDYRRTGDKRAIPILQKAKFFIKKWKATGMIYTNYKADGKLRNREEFVGAIGILIPVINLYDKKAAAEIYKVEVVPYFAENGCWMSKHDYYGRNLLWFGEYMYTNKRLLK